MSKLMSKLSKKTLTEIVPTIIINNNNNNNNYSYLRYNYKLY